MIAKIAIPIIIVVLLSALYFDWQRWRKWRWWQHALNWLLPILTIGWTWKLSRETDYFPDDIEEQNHYLLLLCLYVVPLFITAVCGCIGLFMKKRKQGEQAGWILSVLVAALFLYGTYIGFQQFEVRHIELAFDDLPEAFDGYRIVQFSDAHVGTYTGFRKPILQRAVDSIKAQNANMVVFTGDLIDKHPDEILQHKALLSSIKAPDGVFSVLGNHDYPMYLGLEDPYARSFVEGRSRSIHRDLGWTLLENSRQRVRRDSVSIVVAGMENDGEGRFPELGDIGSALWGVMRNEFVIMLEHDPSSWRRKILPRSHAQLTLSGHTHGGQLDVFGLSPARLFNREYNGVYRIGQRVLFVTQGLGGVVPFRLGVPGEIVVITLRKSDVAIK